MTGSTTEVSGVVPIIPTPFEPGTEALDLAAHRRLIEHAIALGLSAVCLPAYGSEFYKLTDQERLELIENAVAAADGRIAVLAQCNHGSARGAAAVARQATGLGADVISFALPRLFPLAEDRQLEYAAEVCDATERTVLIQDFSPSGGTVGADFCARLLERSPNFRYIKLEEPRMAPKVRAIRAATDDGVGVLEGWGGLYTLELVDAGIVGIMPGLGLADFHAELWRAALAGDTARARALFDVVTPWTVNALTDVEFYNVAEKRLLAARGLLAHGATRNPTHQPDEDALAYADALDEHAIAAASEFGLVARASAIE